MRKIVKQLLLTITVMAAAQLGFAQTDYVHRVIILNEGQYDYLNDTQLVEVTIGAYDPVADSYVEFDTIPEMRWGSDVIVDGQNIYVAGDTVLIVYDKDTYNRVDSKVIQDIRKISIWNNSLLVTRKSGNHDAYFQVYDKATLNLIYELDTLTGPKYSTEGIAVYNDTAYVAVNNGFDWGNYKSILGIINLNGQSYAGEVDFGMDGVNPDNVMIDGSEIYTLNNKNWDSTGSSITIYNTFDRTNQTYNLPGSVGGCGASVSAASHIYYQRYNTTDSISRFNKTSQVIDGFTETIPGFVYGMVTDTINNLLYITATDYFSYGMAYIMQFGGTVLDSFAVGISAGSLALDVRQSTAIEDVAQLLFVNVYPNPTSSAITLSVYNDVQSIRFSLTDVLGKVMFESSVTDGRKTQTIAMQDYPQGIYLLTVESGQRRSIHKVVKY